MTLYIDEFGDITLTQGDSGEIVISGLNPEINEDVYFSVQTLKREQIGGEIMVQSGLSDTVIISLLPAFTNLLTVPTNKDYEEYQYGIKICYDDSENTVLVANNDYGSVNRMIVYPKKVEGAS